MNRSSVFLDLLAGVPASLLLLQLLKVLLNKHVLEFIAQLLVGDIRVADLVDDNLDFDLRNINSQSHQVSLHLFWLDLLVLLHQQKLNQLGFHVLQVLFRRLLFLGLLFRL